MQAVVVGAPDVVVERVSSEKRVVVDLEVSGVRLKSSLSLLKSLSVETGW